MLPYIIFPLTRLWPRPVQLASQLASQLANQPANQPASLTGTVKDQAGEDEAKQQLEEPWLLMDSVVYWTVTAG